MATKSASVAKTVFKQLDHHVVETLQETGSEVLSSADAWKKYQWTRPYFGTKPKEGYFVWVKEQPSCSFLSCVNLEAAGVKQELNNLTVIEAGLEIDLTGKCESLTVLEERLNANDKMRAHRAKGKLLLKKNSSLYYEHFHQWTKDDQVATDYEFILEEGARLDYTYKVEKSPKQMSLKAAFHLGKNATSHLKILADCQETVFKIHDTNYLEGEGANAISTLRLVGRDNVRVEARSKIVAQAASKGHLDCEGLMLSDSADLQLIPELVCQNREAQITHEASIGKLSDEQIVYLRSRGLREDEAVNLILRGFLEN